MTAYLNASLSLFGNVDVSAEVVDSKHNPGEQFAAIRVGRLYVAFDLATAEKLRDALSAQLNEGDQ